MTVTKNFFKCFSNKHRKSKVTYLVVGNEIHRSHSIVNAKNDVNTVLELYEHQEMETDPNIIT